MIDQKLRAIANRQWGFFSARQAVSAGYGKELQRYHVRCGHWLKVDRALYRLPGYAETAEGEFSRWTLWATGQCENRLVAVSHASALHYYGLWPQKPQSVELTVSSLRNQPTTEGCRLYLEPLTPEDYTAREGFFLTTLRKTLSDLRPDLSFAGAWEKTLRLALERNLLDENSALELNHGVPLSWNSGRAPSARWHHTDQTPAGKTGLSPMEGGEPMTNYSGRTQRSARNEWQVAGRSFTLVEMLVVITIIGILAALLMPAMSNALKTARANTCQNQERQLHICGASYANDMDGWWIDAQNWSRNETYLERAGIQSHPSDRRYWATMLCPEASGALNKSYAYNGQRFYCSFYSYGVPYIHDGVKYTFFRLSQIKRPSIKMAFADGTDFQLGAGGTNAATKYFVYGEAGYAEYGTIASVATAYRHGDYAANLTFFDGHAKLQDWASVYRDANDANKASYNPLN